MTELPHTRSRTAHWLATAAALAAVLGATALLQPATATPASSSGDSSAPAPDPDQAHYPLDCGQGGSGTDVLDAASADFDGDGTDETVAVVRCRAHGGTPPSAVFVLARSADAGAPRVAATLVEQREGMSVDDLAVRGAAISATLLGYSSADVPRCCPDKRRKVKWEWREGKFVLRAAPVAGGGLSV
ncbi:hypothetical protein [Streptomyces reniochalinae]|uniref:Secreted protein n=1 Tax=Streptomyces reniochalinae TaxID=2250578 RepID=A0A367EL95_9ACTN|nr:hypothetical protein [Streptomyces reniochalinae]RCG18878.1 hypothetical protein DQ392_13305 [Streptomyces reniochalinae]